MKIILRLPRSLHTQALADLHRPHAFALERAGFMLTRWGACAAGLVVMPYAYQGFEDAHYIDDPTVGFRIDSHAIRSALQATLDADAGFLHVHAHAQYMPDFGSFDLEEQRRLLPSFAGVVRDAPHGAAVLTESTVAARIWVRGKAEQVRPDRVVIVGHPMHIVEEAK